MATLSLAMIVKNEADVLARCLSGVAGLVDEIIIVDTGSTDATKQIARQFTRKIYDFTWINDFAAARNFAFAQATQDYILWLDADDVIDAPNQARLAALKTHLADYDLYLAPYAVGFNQNGQANFTYYRERIMRRSYGYRWEGFIHECITPAGKVGYTDFTVQHQKLKPNPPQRNLKIFAYHLSHGTVLHGRLQFYYARELMYNDRFSAAIPVFHAFINAKSGTVTDQVEALINLHYCYTQTNQRDQALNCLWQALALGTPTPELCCLIGDHFLNKQDYHAALFWYTNATQVKLPHTLGFQKLDYQGYYPYLQMCVCYHQLGDDKSARRCNLRASRWQPNSTAVLHNKAYFRQIGRGERN